MRAFLSYILKLIEDEELGRESERMLERELKNNTVGENLFKNLKVFMINL